MNPDAQHSGRRQPARAAGAAFVGTTIEWYDFYIYATASALIFGKLFSLRTTRFSARSLHSGRSRSASLRDRSEDWCSATWETVSAGRKPC